MLHILRWDAGTKKAELIGPDQLPPTDADLGESVYWIDLDNPTPEEEERVLKRFHARARGRGGDPRRTRGDAARARCRPRPRR